MGVSLSTIRLRLLITLAMFAVGAGLAGAALAIAKPPTGGTFRIGHSGGSPFIDFALTSPFGETGEVASLTCLTLLNFNDAARQRLVPEAAAGYPKVSKDGRTYTFRIRRGLRFSNGQRVTAETFAFTINRTLEVGQYAASLLGDVVGADEVVEGKAKTASGIRARGSTLAIALKEPAPDFPVRTFSFGFCAVPIGLPIDPEGVPAPIHQAGPYYIASWVRDRRIVLERNRFYHGRRPHHVARFVITYGLEPETIVPSIERGSLEGGDVPASESARLAKRYGVNRSQYFAKPTPLVYSVALNAERGLFRDARARRAVNFAVDRRGLVRAGERLASAGPRFGANWGTPTDQWLPPGLGGRDAKIYPLTGNRAKARALLRGAGGTRRVAIYTRAEEPFLTWAQLIERSLRGVGLRVTTKSFPVSVLFDKLGTPGEPWDLALVGAYGADYPDPSSQLALFSGPPIPRKYLRRFHRAERLLGKARYRAFGNLDVALSRDVAPSIPFAALNAKTFVSKRVGCKVLNPGLDLAAACLKR